MIDGPVTPPFTMRQLIGIGSILGSVIGIITFVAGAWVGYMAFRADVLIITQNVTEFRRQVKDFQEHTNTISLALNAETNRMSVLEQKVDFASQNIADIRLAIVPKR